MKTQMRLHEDFCSIVNYQVSARAYVSFVAAKMCTVGNFFASNNHLPNLGFFEFAKKEDVQLAISF